jgi:hypothetical protein
VQPALVRLGRLDPRDAFWRSACCKSFVVLIILAAVVKGVHLCGSDELITWCCLPLLALEVGFVVMSCAFTTAGNWRALENLDEDEPIRFPTPGQILRSHGD